MIQRQFAVKGVIIVGRTSFVPSVTFSLAGSPSFRTKRALLTDRIYRRREYRDPAQTATSIQRKRTAEDREAAVQSRFL